MQAAAPEWLRVAERKLSARDLLDSRSFATRARAADPNLPGPDQIIAIVDTLLAGDRRIGIHHPDWYSILRLTRHLSRDRKLVGDQYLLLSDLLNPQTNQFPFSDEAFKLVDQAWNVLSDPAQKSLYDKELSLHRADSNTAVDPVPSLQHSVISSFGGRTATRLLQRVDPTRKEVSNPLNFQPDCVRAQSRIISTNDGYNQDCMQRKLNFNDLTQDHQNVNESFFWTTCPNCNRVYKFLHTCFNSTIHCQNCLRVFKPMVNPLPKNDAHISLWDCKPVELSVENKEKDKMDAMPFDNTAKYNGMFHDDLSSFMENNGSMVTNACSNSNVVQGSGFVSSSKGSSSELMMLVDEQSKNSSDMLSSTNGSGDQSFEFLDTAYNVELEELYAMVNISDEPMVDLEDDYSIEKWFT